MTVKELKEALAGVPDEAEVILDYSFERYGVTLFNDQPAARVDHYEYENGTTDCHISTYAG